MSTRAVSGLFCYRVLFALRQDLFDDGDLPAVFWSSLRFLSSNALQVGCQVRLRHAPTSLWLQPISWQISCVKVVWSLFLPVHTG